MKQLLLLVLLCMSLSCVESQSAAINVEPILVDKGSPIYPPLAKTARVTGQVKVEFVVNNAGRVASATAVSGSAMLAPAAVDAVNAWKFRMPKRDSLEDLHLETVFDYRLGGKTPQDLPRVEFDSFHRVTLIALPPVLENYPAQVCPDAKELSLFKSPEMAALAELSRAMCYVEWENPGATSLMHAAAQRDVAKVRVLIHSGARVWDSDVNGWTPLMYAAVHGDSAILRILIAAGADVNQHSLLGNTPTMISAARGDFHNEFVRAAANLNAQNAAGTTTLMILAARAGPDEISAALKAGADVAVQDKENRTALDYLYLANCGKSPIREQPLTQAVPARNPCSALDTNGTKVKQLLQSVQRTPEY